MLFVISVMAIVSASAHGLAQRVRRQVKGVEFLIASSKLISVLPKSHVPGTNRLLTGLSSSRLLPALPVAVVRR
jgi:hypothetical protein